MNKKRNPNLVYKLKKMIYGLKQSLRMWYGKLSNYLISYNFKVSSAGHSLATKNDEKYDYYFSIY
jgi:Reverse transcriptase (RNA-dependent DNA polymerase)